MPPDEIPDVVDLDPLLKRLGSDSSEEVRQPEQRPDDPVLSTELQALREGSNRRRVVISFKMEIGLGQVRQPNTNDDLDLCADAARLFVMFASPPEQTIEWSSAGVEGAQRYLRRVWNFAATNEASIKSAGAINTSALDAGAKKFRRDLHATLKQANYDYSRLQYNTVISACMKLLNALEENRQAPASLLREGLSILLRVLYPACPHIAHALWSQLDFTKEFGDLLDAPWPEPDPVALEQDEIELVVQVNGKLRGHICVPKNAAKEAVEQIALNDEGVKRHTEGKSIKKIIVVPGKLVNVVA